MNEIDGETFDAEFPRYCFATENYPAAYSPNTESSWSLKSNGLDTHLIYLQEFNVNTFICCIVLLFNIKFHHLHFRSILLVIADIQPIYS